MTDGHYSVLEYGYVKLITHWGSDEQIIEAARMSTNKGFQGWDTDAGLLRYLYKNKHMTPFEMAGLTVEVYAPIFVFREWHRHRTQSYNEMSGRYTPLPDVNYTPTMDRCLLKNPANKQASGIVEVDVHKIYNWLSDLAMFYDHAERMYQLGLEAGLPKEVARIVLPVGRYSRMRASANLRNWIQFLTLREAPNAQYEIRQYAHAIAGMIEALFPRTYELYDEDKS